MPGTAAYPAISEDHPTETDPSRKRELESPGRVLVLVEPACWSLAAVSLRDIPSLCNQYDRGWLHRSSRTSREAQGSSGYRYGCNYGSETARVKIVGVVDDGKDRLMKREMELFIFIAIARVPRGCR